MADNQLRVTLLGDASKLNATLNTASGRLKKFGQGISSVGKSLQTRMALPLAVAGGAAIKMAADFDKSMTKIQSLVGLTGDEVDGMRGQVRQMASQFAVSSSQAAEALFFITSAGLRGSEAMDTLEASLKASAVGLGETATIADLATSAMNAYGSDSLGASQATDVLTAAVREGKLEASELAAAMGGVLPVASNMGVQFHEVGAAFAAMSRTGTGAAEGATQLNSILSGLLKPTKDAEKALNEMGLSSSGLKQQIKEEGLLSTLETLKGAFDTNSDAAARVFPNIRALRGVLDLMGSGAETNIGIFNRMNTTMGATQAAFDATSQSAEFKLRKAMGDVRESFSQLGSQLLTGLMPIFQQVSGAIQQVFAAFFNLDQGTQKLILGLGAIAVALPTIITLVGSLTTIMGVLLSPIGLVAAALAGVAFIIYKNWGGFKKVLVSIINYFIDLYNESIGFRVIVEGIKVAFKNMGTIVVGVINGLVNAFKLWFQGIYKQFSSLGRIIKGVFTLDKDEILGGVADLGAAMADSYTSQFDNLKSTFEDIGSGIGENIQDGFQKVIEKGKIAQVTEDSIQEGVDNIGKKFKGFVTGFIGDVSGGGAAAPAKGTAGDGGGDGEGDAGAGGSGAGGGDPDKPVSNEAFKNVLGFKVALQDLAEVADAVGNEVAGAFDYMSTGIVESLGLADDGFQGFVKGLVSTILKLISMMLAQSISQAIAGATASGAATGPAAIFTTPAFIATAVGGVMSAFAAIPKFADGGIVSGTTLGIMGEYTGAKQNPEVIAPLNKLEAMIGGKQTQQVNVGGEFRIQGQDLVVALQRADRNRGRLK
jgi:TP901 family phage tail tape measure protein